MSFLETEHLTKRIGGIVAVDDVTVAIEFGELIALVGPNGAGKSTLFNLISGHTSPSAGRIRFAGKDISGMAPHRIAALGLVRTFQLVQLFGHLTALENVKIGFHLGTAGGIGAALLRPPWFTQQERDIERRARDILESVGLAAATGDRAENLSYGQQRLLEVARAAAARPTLMMLDEPAAGLNPQETAALAALIRKFNSSGVTVLLVEHDMGMVMQLANRIVVLDSGRLIADGTPDQIRRDPAVVAAYLGAGPSRG